MINYGVSPQQQQAMLQTTVQQQQQQQQQQQVQQMAQTSMPVNKDINMSPPLNAYGASADSFAAF